MRTRVECLQCALRKIRVRFGVCVSPEDRLFACTGRSDTCFEGGVVLFGVDLL